MDVEYGRLPSRQITFHSNQLSPSFMFWPLQSRSRLNSKSYENTTDYIKSEIGLKGGTAYMVLYGNGTCGSSFFLYLVIFTIYLL
ncbi:hypothetical protein VN97_g9537 [Penicillium thymicola]|uniref:Uncharacterized protein n=1 Tax=Penicillium thymicola TaxID=293382 RepID=A0AAI9X4N9_PENTH|nr:hypothetical protein VN97_g9537 [Penicillium thymicola]